MGQWMGQWLGPGQIIKNQKFRPNQDNSILFENDDLLTHPNLWVGVWVAGWMGGLICGSMGGTRSYQ